MKITVGVGDSITYFVQSSQIPDVEISEAKVNYLGAGFVVPGVVKYPETWKVKILLDNNMTYYKLLQKWQETISSFKNNQGR